MLLLLLLLLSSAAANRRERLRERRKSILQRDIDALEMLHDSLQPVGEVAARVAGGRRCAACSCMQFCAERMNAPQPQLSATSTHT
jgi:hypothetical protein